MARKISKEKLKSIEEEVAETEDVSSEFFNTEYNPQEHKDRTRSEIAQYFVKGYFAIAVFIFVFSFVYNLCLIKLGKESLVIDIIQTFTAVSGALSGLLGFVLGYYFKSEEGN